MLSWRGPTGRLMPEYSEVLEGTIDAIATQIVALRSPSLISFLERAQADLPRQETQ